MKKFILNHTRWFYFLVFVVLSAFTCFLQPHDDDWEYIGYFDNAKQWGFGEEWFVHDCILFPGRWWRPIWSLFNKAMVLWCPLAMPYANHIFVCFAIAGIAYMVYLLCVRLKVKRLTAIVVSLILIFATTSMGALASVDSFSNVYAGFFGLMSVLLYLNNKGWRRWVLWFVAGWLAAMSKETGFVWFVAAPVMDELLIQKDAGMTFSFAKVDYKRFIPRTLICCLPIVLYLGLYVALKPQMLDSVGVTSEAVAITEVTGENVEGKSMLTIMTELEPHPSYKLSPHSIVKNIAVLYLFGIVPIDTSAIYYRSYLLLGITALLSLIWAFALFSSPCRKNFKNQREEIIVLLLLALWISGPSLITRAGEISPIVHMTVFAFVAALLFNNIQWTKLLKIGLACFLLATLVTDAHKCYLSYQIGAITREIARKVVSETEGKPEKVLMVQVISSKNKKDGVFIVNPTAGITRGAAMLREYGYEYPKEMGHVKIPEDEQIGQKLDSIVSAARGTYDCVWFCHDVESKVYNLN